MKILLDTHTWLWWMTESKTLSPTAFDMISDTDNQSVVSVVSVWEVAIKWRLEKLDLPEPPRTFIPSRLERDGFSVLHVTLSHVLQVADLPDHHKDPFDRLLIAQSLVEDVPLLSRDELVSQYDIKVLW